MSHGITHGEDSGIPAYLRDAPEPNYLVVYIVEVILMLLAVTLSYQIASGFWQGFVLVILALVQVIIAALFYMRLKYETWWYAPFPVFAWFLGFVLMAALSVK
jgi:uncharacterized protein (DUF983 family)